MNEYTCEWAIAVSAQSPQAAANTARKIQLDPKNRANHFTVFDNLDTGDESGHFNATQRTALTNKHNAIRRLWDARSDILENTSSTVTPHDRRRALSAIDTAQRYALMHPEVERAGK